MIIPFNKKYEEDVKKLLLELGEYISSIDKEGYNITSSEYKNKYYENTIKEVNKYNGKILLYEEDNKILGLVIGIINNEVQENYDFNAPKRGRITELIVSKKVRSKGIGSRLLHSMEDYLHSVGCEKILIGVFAYNENAIKFYNKNGYHLRMIDMIN